MSQPAARTHDSHDCNDHDAGKILAGSLNVFIENLPAARVGDSAKCHGDKNNSISDGSATVFINGKSAARQGDAMAHGGKITGGAAQVFIGSGGDNVHLGNTGEIYIGGGGKTVLIGGGVSATAEFAGAVEGAELGVEGGPFGMLVGAVVGAIIVFYLPPPSDRKLKGFPDAKEIKKKGGRTRWKDSKRKIYEWDSQHGKVEVYDKTGKKHLGEFDPDTGEQTKPADKSRKTEK